MKIKKAKNWQYDPCCAPPPPPPGERVLPYLAMGVPWWWPRFLRFLIQLGPYFMPQIDLIDLLFLHLVREILGPRIDLFFYENVLFSSFKHFASIFHWFLIKLTPCFIGFRSFWPLIFTKLRSDWVHFLLCAKPQYWKSGEAPCAPDGALCPFNSSILLACFIFFWIHFLNGHVI